MTSYASFQNTVSLRYISQTNQLAATPGRGRPVVLHGDTVTVRVLYFTSLENLKHKCTVSLSLLARFHVCRRQVHISTPSPQSQAKSSMSLFSSLLSLSRSLSFTCLCCYFSSDPLSTLVAFSDRPVYVCVCWRVCFLTMTS